MTGRNPENMGKFHDYQPLEGPLMVSALRKELEAIQIKETYFIVI
jgi:hypothetical protein